MSMYTKDIKEPGQKIYFLNDDNIAFDKNNMSCVAGFNAVASQQELTSVYSEFKNVSSDFYKLSSNVETSAAALDGKIDGVSAAVDTKFLPLSGGEVNHLSVSNGLTVSKGLTAYGLIDTDQVKTNETGDITVRGKGKHGSIDIQFEGGMNSISVNGASLSSYIRDSINELDVDTVKAGEGKIFDEIKQRDGKISATIRDLVSADIPELPVSKISRLEDDYATKVYADSHISAFTLSNDGANRALWLINKKVDLNISVDTDNFIKDGMIDSVLTAAGGTSLDGTVYPPEDGPYIRIKWNTESGKTDTWLKSKDFANIYKSGDPGIKVEDFKISLDYGVVAKTDVVTDLVAYAAELSAPATGAIDVLSAGVDSALSSTALTVKFLGHIIIHADETPHRSFRQILEDAGLFKEHSRVKNGSMYQVTYLNSSRDPVGSESRYETTDGLVLGDGDYVYVHKHGLDAYVQADEIVVSGDSRTVYLANPVHRYDIADLSQFVIGNFVKLSGGNEISGINNFYGINNFRAPVFALDGMTADQLFVTESANVGNLSAHGANNFVGTNNFVGSVRINGEISAISSLSVGFDKLFDLRDGKSLNNLSCEINSEIKELSAALSGEISARAMISVDRDPTNEFKFKHISRDEYHDLVLSVDDKAVDPNTLYVVSSDDMSMYGQKITDLADGELSGDACTYGQLSAFKTDLSGEISSLSGALSGEIGALSGKLSAEISSRTMLSVDRKSVQEFRFYHISQEDYHDLVMGDGKSIYGVSCDPNTLYIISSDDMSMYGQKITDLKDGELSNDACTYGQLQTFKMQVKSAINEALPKGTLEENLSASLSAVLKCLFEIKTALS